MKIDPDEHLDKEPSYSSQKMKRFSKIKKSNTKSFERLPIGRIIFLSPDCIHVFFDHKLYPCSMKGTLKKQLKEERNRLACGDLVRFEPEKKVIHHLEKRKSILMRQNPSQRHKDQILATNIDLLLITASVVQPALNPYLIDLYLVAAQRYQLSPIIVINKVDLLDSDEEPIRAKKDRELLQALKKQYQALHIPFLEVSASSSKGFKELSDLMKDKASVFSGESGVGKSSLINALGESELKVSEVSHRHKGTHTTTSSQLLSLPQGGWCVDTPGIQSFGFKNIDLDEIKHYFPELKALPCKFSDCNHLGEEGCALKEAIEKNEITALRWSSYERMIQEVQGA